MFKFSMCLSFLLTPTAYATSAEHTPEEIIVSTTSRQAAPLLSEGRSLSVVQADELEKLGATHINEIAHRAAGVNFSRNNGQEYLASIRSPIFTGAGACGAFLTAQDGVPLRSAGFCNVNELFEAFTETAARIEVTRGPGSAFYGSNALHGIINVISAPVRGGADYASLEGGSYGYARLNSSKAFIGDTHGLRLTATLTHDGGYREDSGLNQQKLALRHEYDNNDWTLASNLRFTRLDQDTAGYITGLDAYKDRATAKTNPNPEAFRKATSFRYSSTLSRQVSEAVRWQATPYFRHLEMDFRMHFLPGKPLEENSQTSIGLQNGFYIKEDTPFSITIGTDLEYARGSLQQTQDKPTVGSAFLKATIPAGKQYDYDVDSYMAAGFLHTDIKLSSKLTLTAGTRLEHIKYDYTNNMRAGRTDENGIECGFGGCRYSRPRSGSNSFTAFSPKLTLLYEYSPQYRLFLNASHGFRAPQAAELYRLQRDQSAADLKKVSLKSLELGFKGGTDRYNYSLAFYLMEKKDYIFRDSDFFNINGGASNHIGVEAMLDIQLNKQLTLTTNASFAKHTYDFDYDSNGINLNGNDVDTAPRHFGSMQLNWAPTNSLEMELEWVHMGSYYLDPENLHKYGGHDYLNLRASYRLSEKVKIFARLINITNVQYAERADYTRFTDERYFPGKPTTFFAGIRFVL